MFDNMKGLIIGNVKISTEEFTDSDIDILFYCSKFSKSIGELSKLVGIAQKNLIARVKILEGKKLISVKRLGRGKKTLITTNHNKPNIKKLIKLRSEIEKINNKK